jgi:hypothetical protein
MLLSQRDYAAHRGCSPSAVAKAVADGRITTVNGKIDRDKADKEWEKNTNPAYHAPKDEEQVAEKTSRRDVKMQRDLVELAIRKMDLSERTGKLIDGPKAQLEAFTASRAARDRVLSVPRRIAPKLVGKTDPEEIARITYDELEKELYGLADFLDGGNRS